MRAFAQLGLVALVSSGCARPSPPAAAPDRACGSVPEGLRLAAPDSVREPGAGPGRVTVAVADSAPGVVRGVVRDSASGAPVEAIQVMLVGTVCSATTDPAGRFALPARPAGDYALRARRIGYEAAVVYFTLAPGKGAVVEFRLPQRVRPLEFHVSPVR
jgi:hypothetical protein